MAKKKKKPKKILLLTVFIIILLIFFIMATKFLKIELKDEQIVKYIFNNNEINFKNYSKILLNYTFNTEKNFLENTIIEEEKENKNKDPLVYIYNTHPTEYYAKTNFEIFNITPTVITASHILSQYLSEYNIENIVETRNVTDILNTNNWGYSYSYDASRLLVEDILKKNETVNFFIDIHRDAAEKNITTTEINGESCAKIMLVVGLEHENYEKNLKLSNYINEEILKIDESLSRGVLKKQGAASNGIYNQDLHENLILVELGAQYNTVDEVNCSLKYLSEILKKIILEEI